MSKISTYEVTPVPKLADKLIGTSVGGEIEDITYNFTLSELLNLFIPNIPANTLQGILDYGNEATQDIILNGTIFTTYIEITDAATILNSYLTGEVHLSGALYDSTDSAGTAGQVLRSTGDGVEWYSVPTIIPTLQQVLASGNTADINIILSANIQALTATANNVVSNTSLSVNGTLKDKDASVGTAGQILSSTGTKVQWIDLPIYAATSPLSINNITKTISIQKSGSTQDGYLSSADWISFAGKQDAISLTTVGSSGPSTLVGTTINVPNYTLAGLGGVPQTRTLTINGVTYNLAADRTWTIAAGVSSVTATSPLFSTGGVNPDISIQKASSSLDGYLSSADWITFNDKQPAGNYITSLTGEAIGTGPGATAVTLSNSAVIGKLLTGLNITGGTVVSTDSILTAFGKVQNQINSLVGGVIYKGVWNAATNTPTLTSSVGVQGNYYIVNVAGSTNLNGITDWNVGDWAIFNGSTWNKVDNTDAVTSVNGQTGAVSLTTDNIPEGTTNLYYLNSRARAALSFAAGSGAYNSTTGVITIPTNTNQLTNGAAFITLGSLSASSPLSYNSLTGAFAIQVANSTQNGYLSSTDWNTFNSKQAFLNGTGLVKSVAGTISYITDNSTNWNTAYDNMIVSAAVTGTATKTLTLTQQDAGTITASWTDNGLTSVGVSMPSAFSVANSPLTSNGTIAITGAGSALQYIDGTGALQTFPTIATEAATLVTEVYNETGATLTKGTVVYINGGHGNLPTVTKALATSDATSAQTYGVVQVDITNMNNGHVVVIGSLGDLDTQAYANGTILYLSSTTAGAWTSVKQYAPAHLVYVGIVVRSHPTQGVVEVKIQNGYELDELHNVAAQSPSNGNILQYVSSTQLWTAVAGTTTNIAEGTNLYYLDSRARAALSFVAGSGAYNSTTGVITIPTNNNQITNGANYITLGSLSATAPLSYNNLTGAFSISQSGASTNGYLSSTDWNTFNDKQPFITAGTTLQYYRGDKTFQTLNTTAVPEGTNLYYTNARTIASTLTGYVSGAGTITSADSLLTAIQKLNGNIGGLTTGVSSVFGRTGAVIAVSGDYTTTLVPEGTNLYYLDSRARAAVSLTTTGSSGASTYNSTTGVFNIPNYGAALSGYVPTSRTLNINGTSYDLSADRSWSVGTVTSVAALTLGTTGTDLSSSVATGTTTPVITLNVPTASAANRGVLSSADWSTFNAKVSGVTATSPLASSGGTTPNITIQQSSGSQAGYLSAADWTTFNNKQASGNYITSLTGEATATGPGAASVTLSNSAVTGKVLTGINITGGTVVDTDSILTGFGKLQNQINGLIGGTIYKGTWNASTNVPALASGVGTKGWYYIVNVAGTTNLDGITDWFVGDWAIFDGTAWQQVDNTDAVVSVNGQTGAVSLTTDNIPEGSTNQYFLNSRARSALSFTAGSGAYNSTTGVITIPTNTSQLTNGANFITLASLSGVAPIVYSNTTGAISITQAGTASNGYLSSTDWNTFNNKQNALTNPVTGTGTVNYLPKFTGASTIGNSLAYDGGSSIGINTNAPYDSTQFKLDVNGGFIVKNTSGVAAQFVLIDANPASGGNAGFFIQSVGGTSTAAWGQIQTYYGTSIAAGALRLQPSGGQVLVGTTTGSAFMVDINGTLRVAGQLTLGSTITNGTYTYTLPGATGTIALVGGAGVGTVTSVAALTIGTTGTDLSSTVANSTTTPVITLNVPTASAANRGALSSADWTTFNNKQATITLTTTGTSGAATLVGATLNIPNYGSALTGYVPYTGATAAVNLGVYGISASSGSFSGSVQLTSSGSSLSTTYGGVTTMYQLVDTGGGILKVDGDNTIRIVTNNVNRFQVNSTAATFTIPISGTSATFSSIGQFQGYSLSGDFGANYTIGLGVGMAGGVQKGVNIGWNNVTDFGFIGTVHNGTAWKSLVLNPIAGNVYIGATGTGNFYAGATTISGALTANSTITAGGIVQTSNAVDGGGFVMWVNANAGSRSWKMVSDSYNYGDFGLQQATTYGGSVYANKLIVNAGNLTIGSVPGTGSGNLYAAIGVFTSSITATGATLQSANTAAVVDIFTLYNPSAASSGVRQRFQNGYGDLAAIKVSQRDNGALADDGQIEFQVASNSVLDTKLTILNTGASTFSSSVTATGGFFTGLQDGVVNQDNGTSAVWRGRILSKNSTSDKAAFLGTYGSIAGVFAHNNALDNWADLYVNTVSGTTGGSVRLPITTYINTYAAVYESGTWGISITGNAGTSTTTTFVASPDGGRNPNTAPLPTTNPRAVSYNFAGAVYITGATGNYAGVMTYAPWDGTSASTGDSSYQLAFCNWSGVNASGLPGLAIRNGINSSWNSTWYQFLHSGNYNSYAPTLTGGGASGTWGISITGSAALLNGISSTQIFNNMGNSHGTYTDFNSVGDFGVRYLQGSTNGPNTGSSQYYGFTLGLGNQYAYGTYGSQFYWNRTPTGGNPYVSVRFQENGTWTAWSKIYAGYADTAGSTSSATTAGTVTHNASRTDATSYNVVWATGNPSQMYSCDAVQIQSSTGTLYATNLSATRSYAAIAPTVASTNWVTSFQNTPVSTMAFGGDISAGGPTGTWWFQVNMRHSNPANYWGTQLAYGWEDNANEIYQRNVTGGNWSSWVRYLNSNNYTSYAVPIGGATLDNIFYYRTNQGSYLGVLNSARLQVYNTDGGSAFMSFHRSGYYAVNFGLDADNVMRIGGWSAAANRWQLDMSGNQTVAGTSTATGFFESSDSRFKQLIQDNYRAVGVQNIKPKLYIKDGKEEVGYFAQDFQFILASAVSENNEGFLNLSYTQVHTAKIAIIEDEVDVLKRRVTELEYKLQKYEA